MPSRRFLTKLVAGWLPVACLLGLAFVAAPQGSADSRIAGSLSISPHHFYGGQAVTFSGSIGRGGKHKIWLEFNMNRPGDDWTRIDGSTHSTDASGHFKFQFPARGMLNISVRVATQGTATPGVKFQAEDQAVSLAVASDDALDRADGCRPDSNLFKSYFAPTSTQLHINVDATPDGEPVLKDRPVTLQQRTGSGAWTDVTSAHLDAQGEASFPVTQPTEDDVVYRAVLGAVQKGANRIGWFPSFPTYLRAKDRPHVAAGVHAADPTPGAPNPADIDVAWGGGSAVVAWNKGTAAPTTPANADGAQPVTAGSPFNLDDLTPDQDYAFSVFARSTQGICAAPGTTVGHTDPTPPVSNVHSTDAPVPSDHVSLAWDLPNIPPGIIDEIKVRRADGPTPPTNVAGPSVADFAFAANSATDFGVAPSTTYSYSVFVKINGVWSVNASTTVTTGAQQ